MKDMIDALRKELDEFKRAKEDFWEGPFLELRKSDPVYHVTTNSIYSPIVFMRLDQNQNIFMYPSQSQACESQKKS